MFQKSSAKVSPAPNNVFLFAPRSISIIESPCHPLIPQKEIIDINILNKIIESPWSNPLNEISDENTIKTEIIDPTVNKKTDDDGIQAARLIVIRRRKMKKHKLQKLRKKMKFEWAKVRQRREMRKEKAFQAVLINQIKEAEKFSAENYVLEKIRQATEVPIPRYYKGRRLPQFLIKELLGIK